MALCLIAAAVGLLVGFAYCLRRRSVEPSTLALFGIVVVVLGQGTTPYFYPFGVGLLLGSASDALEDEWYGPAVARNARVSHRARLFLMRLAAVARRGIRIVSLSRPRNIVRQDPNHAIDTLRSDRQCDESKSVAA